jgi:hypothetical protein
VTRGIMWTDEEWAEIAAVAAKRGMDARDYVRVLVERELTMDEWAEKSAADHTMPGNRALPTLPPRKE